MTQEVRVRILLFLDERSRSDSPEYVEDTALAEAMGESVPEIRRQLDILSEQGLIHAANAFDKHNAEISPAGTLAVEGVVEAASQPPKPPVGFGRD